jgi:hypothetical protein
MGGNKWLCFFQARAWCAHTQCAPRSALWWSFRISNSPRQPPARPASLAAPKAAVTLPVDGAILMGFCTGLNWSIRREEFWTQGQRGHGRVGRSKARDALPEKYPLKDVVFNLQRCALLPMALSETPCNPAFIRECMKDRVHQNQRAPLVPGLEECIWLPSTLGNPKLVAVALSGAGPTIIAFCTGDFNAVRLLPPLPHLYRGFDPLFPATKAGQTGGGCRTTSGVFALPLAVPGKYLDENASESPASPARELALTRVRLCRSETR